MCALLQKCLSSALPCTLLCLHSVPVKGADTCRVLLCSTQCSWFFEFLAITLWQRIRAVLSGWVLVNGQVHGVPWPFHVHNMAGSQ
jgi:hypothetical protein